jgi:hypothetical protein
MIIVSTFSERRRQRMKDLHSQREDWSGRWVGEAKEGNGGGDGRVGRWDDTKNFLEMEVLPHSREVIFVTRSDGHQNNWFVDHWQHTDLVRVEGNGSPFGESERSGVGDIGRVLVGIGTSSDRKVLGRNATFSWS